MQLQATEPLTQDCTKCRKMSTESSRKRESAVNNNTSFRLLRTKSQDFIQVLWFSRVFSLFSSINRLTASFTPSSLPSSPSLHMNLTDFLHALLIHTFHFFRHAIILLLSVIAFMHGIYSYIPATNYVSRVHVIVLQLFCSYSLWYM